MADEAPLVPIIFDLYARRRLGTRAIANWLTDRGYRTRSGCPWSHAAVVTVLRNRAYVGEVYFRDQWHEAPHPPLVSAEIFEVGQGILSERGEGYAKRATNSSEYLLTGLMRCTRCHQQYLGVSGTGRSASYRYYVCYSRQRYGRRRCDADRLPAELLESEIRAALRETFRHHRMLRAAIEEWRATRHSDQPQVEAQLAQVVAEIARGEESIEHYLLAFEARTMPESLCAPRVGEAGQDHRRPALPQG